MYRSLPLSTALELREQMLFIIWGKEVASQQLPHLVPSTHRALAFSPPAYLQPLPPCGSPALQPVGHESHLLLLWSLCNLEESFNFSKPIYEVFDVEISCESWDVHFEAKILKACRLVESSAIATVRVESAALPLILVEPISIPLLFTIVTELSKGIFIAI